MFRDEWCRGWRTSRGSANLKILDELQFQRSSLHVKGAYQAPFQGPRGIGDRNDCYDEWDEVKWPKNVYVKQIWKTFLGAYGEKLENGHHLAENEEYDSLSALGNKTGCGHAWNGTINKFMEHHQLLIVTQWYESYYCASIFSWGFYCDGLDLEVEIVFLKFGRGLLWIFIA